jgi:hypothetical protein
LSALSEHNAEAKKQGGVAKIEGGVAKTWNSVAKSWNLLAKKNQFIIMYHLSLSMCPRLLWVNQIIREWNTTIDHIIHYDDMYLNHELEIDINLFCIILQQTWWSTLLQQIYFLCDSTCPGSRQTVFLHQHLLIDEKHVKLLIQNVKFLIQCQIQSEGDVSKSALSNMAHF